MLSYYSCIIASRETLLCILPSVDENTHTDQWAAAAPTPPAGSVGGGVGAVDSLTPPTFQGNEPETFTTRLTSLTVGNGCPKNIRGEFWFHSC